MAIAKSYNNFISKIPHDILSVYSLPLSHHICQFSLFPAPAMPVNLLLFLLLFLPVCHGCQTGFFTDCQKAPFVPGHNLAGEGFDIVKMQTSGAFVVDVRKFMVGGHDGNCTLCTNTLMNNQVQKLPLSVLDWRTKVRCRRSLSSQIYESSSSVLKETTNSASVSWKVGLGIKGVAGVAVGGTHSKTAMFAKGHSTKDKFSFTSHEFKCEYYIFRLRTQPPLSQEFQDSLKNLPSTYTHKTDPAYSHFISIYGTHYIRKVHLGGRVHSTTAIRTCKMAMSGLSLHSVSNCLGVEASGTIKGVTISAETKYCKSQSKKLKTGVSFGATFSDRVTEVQGGNVQVEDILFNPDKKSGYKTWLKSLIKVPGVVSYQLSSLHFLARDNPILKSNLRNKDCACKCSGHRNVDSNCCPGKPGVARMNVTVVRATGLWGDYFSKTDGYVKVFYGKQGGSTPVIWNNDFPYWNYRIPFGTVDLKSKQALNFEVWDRDNRWNDDLLGKGSITPQRGMSVTQMFKLKHGTLYASLSVVCGPSLKGAFCDQYAPSPGALPLTRAHRALVKCSALYREYGSIWDSCSALDQGNRNMTTFLN
uniref:Perforin 1.3 n=1 Tax=Salmo trutta TaxID=8032 RepID=A0A673ZKJ6_SALTR